MFFSGPLWSLLVADAFVDVEMMFGIILNLFGVYNGFSEILITVYKIVKII